MLKYLAFIILILSVPFQSNAICDCFSERATVCVFRNELIAKREFLPVYLNQVYLGSTSTQAISCFSVSAGSHQLSSDESFIIPQEFLVEAGNVYLFWQEVKFSSNGISSKLHLLYNDDIFWGSKNCTCNQTLLQ